VKNGAKWQKYSKNRQKRSRQNVFLFIFQNRCARRINRVFLSGGAVFPNYASDTLTLMKEGMTVVSDGLVRTFSRHYWDVTIVAAHAPSVSIRCPTPGGPNRSDEMRKRKESPNVGQYAAPPSSLPYIRHRTWWADLVQKRTSSCACSRCTSKTV
jgi:hypothetical protein